MKLGLEVSWASSEDERMVRTAMHVKQSDLKDSDLKPSERRLQHTWY